MKKKYTPTNTYEGIVKRHPDGFGFFIPDGDQALEDVYLSRRNMQGLMSNDRVQISLARGKYGRTRGRVQAVIKRANTQLTGPLYKLSDTQALLVDETYAWGEDLKLSIAQHPNIKDGTWVGVKILSYPEDKKGFCGQIIEVLGTHLEAHTDNSRVLIEHHIPTEFKAEPTKPQIEKKDLAGRTDLTKLCFVTIDGQTAQDFDDAIYVETNAHGFRLCVAIADVSHYVKPDTVLDKDAVDRGVSTYFPKFVNPMLPSVLSDDVCSLRPHKKRLVLVADMQLDFKAQLVSKKFYEAVICSHARLTYAEAQDILDGPSNGSLDGSSDTSPNKPSDAPSNRSLGSESNKPSNNASSTSLDGLPNKSAEKKYPPTLAPMIETAGRLAQLLLKARQNHSLILDLPESVVKVNAQGEAVDILRAERLFAHQLIEELMLVANIAAAEFLIQHRVPTLFRVHDKPEAEALQTLAGFMGQCGYKLPLKQKHLQRNISQALKKLASTPYKQVLNILTLRSQSQALYSPQNIGHFGLGFEKYVHFTSPIRRYPDLIVHRSIKAALKVPGYGAYGADKLASMGTWLSACEQRSVKAERQIIGIKKARFILKYVGQSFTGSISSVVKFGVFVTLRTYDVDGLVPLEQLPGYGYEFNEAQLMLRNKKTGRRFSVGDVLKVVVLSSDTQTGRIRFALEHKG